MIRRSVRCLLALGLAAALAPCMPSRAAAQDAAEKASTAALRPGDVVQLRIWREPDLSGEFPIAADGVVVLPKIGPLRATDDPPEALERRIVELFGRYLRNPSIEIIFLRRVNIQGAVRQPGLYPLDPTMVVADAIAMAGGLLPNGRPDRIELRRTGEKLTVDIGESTRIGDLPVRSGDQLYVPERNWFIRNQGLVAAILSATTSIVLTILTIEATN